MTTTNVLELIANASDTGFEELTLVEPGVYKLELDANKTKKDGVFVKGRVLEGPYQGKLVGCGQLTFNEKAIGIAIQNLTGMGIDREQLSKIAALNPGSVTSLAEGVAKFIKGRIVNASIKYNEYNGEIRNQFEIGKLQLVSAPAPPAVGGIPEAAAPAVAAPTQAAPTAPTTATAVPVAVAPVAAAPVAAAPVAAAPVAAAPAPVVDGDPGF